MVGLEGWKGHSCVTNGPTINVDSRIASDAFYFRLQPLQRFAFGQFREQLARRSAAESADSLRFEGVYKHRETRESGGKRHRRSIGRYERRFVGPKARLPCRPATE